LLDPPRFKTGDKVRLKTGKSPIIVLEVDYFTCDCPQNNPPRIKKWKRPRKGWYIRFMYASAMSYHYNNQSEYRTWREADDFVFFDPQEAPMPTLYQTTDQKPRYGTFLTKDSQGRFVLEMKGGGGVEAFDPKDIEEVLPHTVELTRFEGGDHVGEKRHYQMAEGKVKMGDVLLHLSNGNLWEVTGLNTKSKTNHQSKNGFLVLEGQRVVTDN